MRQLVTLVEKSGKLFLYVLFGVFGESEILRFLGLCNSCCEADCPNHCLYFTTFVQSWTHCPNLKLLQLNPISWSWNSISDEWALWPDFYQSLIYHFLQVDLTEYVEKHEFVFDAVLNEDVSNDKVSKWQDLAYVTIITQLVSLVLLFLP